MSIDINQLFSTMMNLMILVIFLALFMTLFGKIGEFVKVA